MGAVLWPEEADGETTSRTIRLTGDMGDDNNGKVQCDKKRYRQNGAATGLGSQHEAVDVSFPAAAYR